jgi:RPA family protein
VEKKRNTAIKTKIKPIITGKFSKQEGMNSSYVITDLGMRLSRVRILSTIVDKFSAETGKFAAITLDDGTGTIRAKAFNAVSIFEGLEVGNIVDVVGKLKEYQGEVYLVPELIMKIDDPNWETLRALEMKKSAESWQEKRKTVFEYQKQVSDLDELKKVMKERFGIMPADVESIAQTQEVVDGEEEGDKKAKDAIIKLISELDTGEGCDYSELITKSGMSEDVLDSIINGLLEEGVCFEPRPGKIKKL